MKIGLKTALVTVTGIALVGIIVGETSYIIKNKKDMNSITTETVQLKSKISQLDGSLKEKEEKLNTIQDIITGENNKVKEETTVKEETSKNSNNNDDNKKKMEDLIGKYSNKTQFTTMAEDRILFSDLQLGEDGTYEYRQSIHAEQGEYGNWYIDKNGDIILNRLFVHSSDAALRISKKSEIKKLTINEDGSLTDSNKKFEGGALNDLSKLVLKKESSSTNFKLFDTLGKYKEESQRQGNDQLIVFGE